MSDERKPYFINGEELVEDDIDADILPAVKVLRENRIETIASCSGSCDYHSGWGSYVQVWLHNGIEETVERLLLVTEALTPELQDGIGNQGLALQLVSVAEWYQDKGIKFASNVPIYRFQLVGYKQKQEATDAWGLISQRFTSLFQQ